MSQTRKRTTTAATSDPLADLRTDEPAGPPAPDDVEPQADEVALFSQEWHDEALARAVVAMHRDTVATGSLHKGGTCPCRYLSRLVIQAAVGEPVEADPDEDDEGRTDGA